MSLTKKQKDLYDFICDTLAKNGVGPSFEEMMVHTGLKSKSGVHRLTTALVERGYLYKIPNRARCLFPFQEPGAKSDAAYPVVTEALVAIRSYEEGALSAPKALGKIKDAVTAYFNEQA